MLLQSLSATSTYFLYGWVPSMLLLWTVAWSALLTTVESTAYLADCALLLCNILKRGNAYTYIYSQSLQFIQKVFG